ncbi:MAG: hypothetical protein J6S14_17215 [Clostridia bacterium]|nr:hypothetical protein [Clostridia bacterium]
MAIIERDAITNTSFDVRAADLVTGTSKIVTWYLDGYSYTQQNVIARNNTSSWFTIDGLDPGTSYVVEIEVDYADGTFETSRTSVTTTGSSSGGGSSGNDRWVIEYAYDCRNTSSPVSQYLNLDRYQVAMFRCSFTESGKVAFSSSGADSTWAALSISSSFDGNSGTPDSDYVVADDMNNNGDFSFYYNVTAGSTYYLFVMHYDSSDYGSMTVYIEPEGSGSSEKWTVYGYSQYTNLSANATRPISLGAMYTAMFTISFVNSGTAKFYTTGSVDTVGYLCTSTGFDSSTGEPTSSPLRTSDDGGSGNNFLISYPVTAGTTYYLFIKCYSSSEALATTVCIDVPTVGAPAVFNWSSAKVAGGTFNITADEWTRLLNKIQEVRVYKGLPEMELGSAVWNFTYPSKGDDFLALHYNQALMGIAGIYDSDGYTDYYDDNAVSSGSNITAAQINLLRTLINNYCE